MARQPLFPIFMFQRRYGCGSIGTFRRRSAALPRAALTKLSRVFRRQVRRTKNSLRRREGWGWCTCVASRRGGSGWNFGEFRRQTGPRSLPSSRSVSVACSRADTSRRGDAGSKSHFEASTGAGGKGIEGMNKQAEERQETTDGKRSITRFPDPPLGARLCIFAFRGGAPRTGNCTYPKAGGWMYRERTETNSDEKG